MRICSLLRAVIIVMTLAKISIVCLSLFFGGLFVSLIAQPIPIAAQLKRTATYPVIEVPCRL